MPDTDPRKPLTVLYDGACPLCRREIAHVKGLADGRADSGLCFVDISAGAGAIACSEAERARLLARFDSGDHLHPGDEGNRAMADAVDLQALLPRPGASCNDLPKTSATR